MVRQVLTLNALEPPPGIGLGAGPEKSYINEVAALCTAPWELLCCQSPVVRG